MWFPNLFFALFFTSSTLGFPWTEGPAARSPPQPFFEQTPSSVMIQPGQTVQIPCRVRHLGDKIVSWIRRKDLHIIASAGFMFTADARFSVLHPEGDSAAWTLQLRGALPQDQGLYECQVNTEPKMKQAVLLTVSGLIAGSVGSQKPTRRVSNLTEDNNDSVPDDAMELSMGDDASAGGAARIAGPREQYVKAGSTWTLTCEVSGLSGLPSIRTPDHHKPDNFLTKPQRLVDWLHEGKLLTYQSSRGGISLDTEHGDGMTISRLTLANLRNEDTGRYVCKPLSLPPAVVTIIVIEGEKTAMLGRNSASPLPSHWVLAVIIALLTVGH